MAVQGGAWLFETDVSVSDVLPSDPLVLELKLNYGGSKKSSGTRVTDPFLIFR